MKQNKSAPPSFSVGGSSLLVIFAVLCLTVFALLSLSTVNAEKRLSDASANAVSAYFQADLEAERIFAKLRSGETVPGVQTEGSIYRYTCAISDQQTLVVELMNDAGEWTILRWQSISHFEESRDSLPVWSDS